MEVIYTKFLGSPLTEEEQALLEEIDDAMLWFDLKYLLGETIREKRPEVLVEPEYRVRDFGDVEAEYLEMFNCLKLDDSQKIK